MRFSGKQVDPVISFAGGLGKVQDCSETKGSLFHVWCQKAFFSVTAGKATVLREWANGIRERWSRSEEMAAAWDEPDNL